MKNSSKNTYVLYFLLREIRKYEKVRSNPGPCTKTFSFIITRELFFQMYCVSVLFISSGTSVDIFILFVVLICKWCFMFII